MSGKPSKPFRKKKGQKYTRLSYRRAFDISCAILAKQEQLQVTINKGQRKNLEEEIQSLNDLLTRGRSRFAAEQHRPIIKAAMKILQNRLQKNKQNHSMTLESIIRHLEQQGLITYRNAAGRTADYTRRQVRKILIDSSMDKWLKP